MSISRTESENDILLIIQPDIETVFLHRAKRFHVLAEKHAYGDYLDFLGRLTLLQHECLHHYLPEASYEAKNIVAKHEHPVPPLSAEAALVDSEWHKYLDFIIKGLRIDAPPHLLEILDSLSESEKEVQEKMAGCVLSAEYPPEWSDRLPIIAAALQIDRTRLAGSPEFSALSLPHTGDVCPCCGSLPVASMLHVNGKIANLRYLHCSLCNTEWNMVRVKCSACGDNRHITYHHIAEGDGAVRAECCDACKSYLKIMRRDKNLMLDPVADDLATLALDILVGEEGYHCAGSNPFFVSGQAR